MSSPAAKETTTITITPIMEATELYHHDPTMAIRQSCHLHLDIEHGTLEATVVQRGYENSMPSSVYHHRSVLWTIPCLTRTAANQLMAEVALIAQRIVSGTEIEWDSANFIGTQDADATVAIDEVSSLIAAYDYPEYTIMEYSGEEYYESGHDAACQIIGITADTSDDDLDTLIEAVSIDALSNNIVIHDLTGYVTMLRDQLREAEREELRLVATDLARLIARRNQLIHRQLSWGDSTRAIGQLTRLSHVGVQKIGSRSISG